MTIDNGTLHDISLSELLFSNDWSLEKTTHYMQHNWVPMSYKITLAYLAIVYWGQKWMFTRKAFDSKAMSVVLAVWNFSFSIFSGYAAYCLLPELFKMFRHHGFVGTYCQNAEYYNDSSTGYWGWMFVMSKAPELGDTMFLILRKRPVIFLHWYHHALTFLYATITYAEKQAWCRWSLALNLSVHTVMYFYFGLQAMKVRAPRPVAKFITSIQILQFVISVYIFTHIVYIKYADATPCDASWNMLSLGGLMYLSYLYLFAQFFYDSYISGKARMKRNLSTEATTSTKKIE
uniref:Elongation of very long chain fatty acids protein n=2 Tax=Globodera rostochiensis TaxID=31243 RepID=A0A914H642_GLORO